MNIFDLVSVLTLDIRITICAIYLKMNINFSTNYYKLYYNNYMCNIS